MPAVRQIQPCPCMGLKEARWSRILLELLQVDHLMESSGCMIHSWSWSCNLRLKQSWKRLEQLVTWRSLDSCIIQYVILHLLQGSMIFRSCKELALINGHCIAATQNHRCCAKGYIYFIICKFVTCWTWTYMSSAASLYAPYNLVHMYSHCLIKNEFRIECDIF